MSVELRPFPKSQKKHRTVWGIAPFLKVSVFEDFQNLRIPEQLEVLEPGLYARASWACTLELDRQAC